MRPTFTVIVPAYNESHDIGPTCEALLQLTPEPEIIFVDDASTDDTVAVLQQYLQRPNVKLIRQPVNRGQGAARNVAVRAATGEAIIFVDADVLVPPDLLQRLARHYEQGADYVAVEAAVANTDTVYGRFFQAQHDFLYGGDKPVGWSQAFSCRRTLALQVGLFTELVPAVGEDGEFVQRLQRASTKGVIDKTIVVYHAVPGTRREFWRQWEGRGLALPLFRRRVERTSPLRLVAERLAGSAWSAVLIVTVVPMARRAAALARRSQGRWADLPSFLVLNVLQLLARRIGEWKGMLRLCLSSPSNAR
jgi:glycosyltransferase involved in cell wall biosynthesis